MCFSSQLVDLSTYSRGESSGVDRVEYDGLDHALRAEENMISLRLTATRSLPFNTGQRSVLAKIICQKDSAQYVQHCSKHQSSAESDLIRQFSLE